MPVQPGLLPSPALSVRGLRSRLLFHWRARNLLTAALTGQVPTFARASAGGLILDRNGNFYAPVHSQPRFEHVDWDGTGVPDDVALLLEAAATNLCKHNTDFTQAVWSQNGTVGITLNAVPMGAFGLAELVDDAAGVNEYVQQIFAGATFTTANAKYVTVVWAKHASAAAGGAGVDLYDSVAAANRISARIQANGDGSPNVTMVAGTLVTSRYLKTVPGVGPVYAITFRATAVTNANNHILIVRPCFDTANTGSAYLGCVQLEEGTGPSTLKITGAAAVSTSSEQLTFAFNLPPQTPVNALTLYARYIDRFTYETHSPGGITCRIAELGTSPVRTYLGVTGAVPAIVTQYDGANTRAVGSAAPAQVHGDRIEVVGTVKTDGAVTSRCRINGVDYAALTTSAFAGPYPSAFSSLVLAFGGENGATNNRLALLDVKIALGEQSLDLMREAF